MPMYLTEEQEMLGETARRFLADVPPAFRFRGLRDANDQTGFSPTLWRQFGEMGLTGVMVAEAQGGLGLGHIAAGQILREIGRNLVPSPFLSTAVGAVAALSYAEPELRDALLPAIVQGTIVIALALDEGPRHRPDEVALAAERDGNGFRLIGTKRFVVHGHVADHIIVSARTAGNARDPNGITLFAVSSDAAGLSMHVDRLIDATLTTRLTFDRVAVDYASVLGEVGKGQPVLRAVLDAARAGAAAELLGVAQSITDMTLDYLKTRKQFGRPIGSYQALQHRSAHLYSELEVGYAAMLKAQQLLDAQVDGASRAASVAKAMAGMASTLATREAIQMHGGIGMTDEYDAGLYLKRQRVLDELFGDVDYQADRLARLAGY